MQPADDSDAAALAALGREADARRHAVLELSKSERLRLVADLCLQGAVLPQPPPPRG